MAEKEKVTIKVKVSAKQVWSGIGLLALGGVIGLLIGYCFFIGGMV